MLLPPLGAVPDDDGTTFTMFSASASGAQVCLFSGPSGATESRHPLEPIGSHLWSGHVSGAGPGDRYGMRVSGPYEPDQGHRYDPAKLLVDPYTRELQGQITPGDALLEPEIDSALAVPRSVIRELTTAPVPPRAGGPVPWPDTVLYELHVRGFTKRCPRIPAELRGTYAGLASDPSLEYLTSLGITSVELLPVHAFASELGLLERGLSNYWGYNSLAFFAPHAPYAAGPDPVAEFREMVGRLHGAGLEVILDVVYNHTAEGDDKGPTLSFRGLDNATYYRLKTDHARYEDHTGCGNTLDLRAPVTLQLVLDSLRYWVTEMGVDGFRFDLTPALTRGTAFLAAVGQDPVLRNVKLIAEPWDLGPHGYQVGHFPTPWAEWNDRFRDTVRDAWRGAATGVAHLGYRLSGSSDVFHHGGRRPYASINFVTAHDGFSLADLVSYEHKHNRANGEHNRDGDPHNRSFNGGVEGPTDDPAVLTARRRVRRAQLATLLLSAGVPMLVAGDEFGRSQQGNNNAYCQDNELSWLAWPSKSGSGDMVNPDDPAGPDPQLLPMVRGLLKLRRENPLLRRTDFFHGGPSRPGALADVTWFRADGQQMSEGDWTSPEAPSLIALLSSPDGAESILLILHPEDSVVAVTLPSEPWATAASAFALLLDTAADDLAGFGAEPQVFLRPGDPLAVSARSVCVLECRSPAG